MALKNKTSKIPNAQSSGQVFPRQAALGPPSAV